jgi:exosortase
VLFGILIASPWVCTVAMLLFFLSFFASARDFDGRSLVDLALPLVMVINLPLGYDQLLSIRLQQVTTALSSVVLDVLAIPHAVSNNVIRLASRELFVAEACSGIQSVFTLMFLATLLVSFCRRPIWVTPIYVAIGGRRQCASGHGSGGGRVVVFR